MHIKESLGWKVFNICNILVMIFMMIVTVYPVIYVVFASFSSPAHLMSYERPLLMPLDFTTVAYKMLFKNPMIIRGYINTIYIVVIGVTLNLVMTSLGAYFLSRKSVLWKNTVMVLIVITMYFGGGLIPFYILIKQIHLYNTLWALIIPGAISTFNLIIMRTAFAEIPDSLIESAKIDGAKHLTILFKIVLPLSLPTIAVMVLYYGVGHWNSWFNAMIFLRKRDLFPLQLILREILIKNDTNDMSSSVGLGEQEMIGETIKYAAIVVATIPILSIYPFLQKYFVKGVMIGALKE